MRIIQYLAGKFLNFIIWPKVVRSVLNQLVMALDMLENIFWGLVYEIHRKNLVPRKAIILPNMIIIQF